MQVVRYDIREMSVWKALICSTHTILVEWHTWWHQFYLVMDLFSPVLCRYLLIFLTVMCFLTMAIICLTGQAESSKLLQNPSIFFLLILFVFVWDTVQDTGSVTGRVQYLMTFVIGGYVTLVVNRWNTLRNTTLGILWGSLENLVIYSSYCGNGRDNAALKAIRDDVLRYARCVILLTFHAARAEDNIPEFQEKKLVTETEAEYLKAAMPGTRPLMAIMWIWRCFDRFKCHGIQIPIEGRMLIQNNVTAARGGGWICWIWLDQYLCFQNRCRSNAGNDWMPLSICIYPYHLLGRPGVCVLRSVRFLRLNSVCTDLSFYFIGGDWSAASDLHQAIGKW